MSRIVQPRLLTVRGLTDVNGINYLCRCWRLILGVFRNPGRGVLLSSGRTGMIEFMESWKELVAVAALLGSIAICLIFEIEL